MKYNLTDNFKIPDKSVKPPNCPKYNNGYCMYYECPCDSVNFKCEWEENKHVKQRIDKPMY